MLTKKALVSPVCLQRTLSVEWLESRVVPANSVTQLAIGFQPNVGSANVLSFFWGQEFYGTRSNGDSFSGNFTYTYGQLNPVGGGDAIPLSDCKEVWSKAPADTTWSVYQNGVKIPVNVKYYSGDGQTDDFQTDLPARDMKVSWAETYLPPSASGVVLAPNLLSVGNEIKVEVRDSSGSATTSGYSIFAGETFQTGSIVLPDADYGDAVEGVDVLRATQGEQAAALVLEANKTYQLTIGELGQVAVFSPERNFQAATMAVSSNRPGMVNASVAPGEGNFWTLTIDTSPLEGKAGQLGLKIENTGASAFSARYLGLVIKDASGQLPTRPDHLAIGTVNQGTKSNAAFFQGTASDDPLKGQVKSFDSLYIYINGGPKQVPVQTVDDQTKFLPDYTSPDAPKNNPPMGYNSKSWRIDGGGYDGKKLIQSLREAVKLGSTPSIVLYNFMAGQLASGKQVAEGPGLALANLKNSDYMLEYFQDFKFVLDTMRQFAQGTTVNLIVEPDFLSYMFVNNKLDPTTPILNYNMAEVAAQAGVLPSGTTLATSAGNTLKDFVLALNGAVRHLSSGTDGSVNVRFGWKLNLWAADTGGQGGISKITDKMGFNEGQTYIKDKAKLVADWFASAGILSMPEVNGTTPRGSDFLAIDKYGIDGGRDTGLTAPGYKDPKATDWFFNADHWNNYLLFVGSVRANMLKGLPSGQDLSIRLWQIPVGHINTVQEEGAPDFGALPNTDVNGQGAFEDSAVSYFFGSTFSGQTPQAEADNAKRVAFFDPAGFGNQAGDPGVRRDASGQNFQFAENLGLNKAADWGVESIEFGAGLPEATSGGGYAYVAPTDNYYLAYKTSDYLKNPIKLDSTPPTFQPEALPDYGTPNRNLAASYSRNFLGREPGPGILMAGDKIDAGQLSPDGLASGILNSTEYHQRAIRKLYLSLLRRNPDASGLNSWVSVSDRGLPIDQVIAGFLSSNEFAQGLSNQEFVQAVFQEILGRQPDGDGLSRSVAALDGGLSRADFVKNLLHSPESTSNLVKGIYGDVLGRAPSAAEIQSWSDSVAPLGGIDRVFQAICTSEEASDKQQMAFGGIELEAPAANILDLVGLEYNFGKPEPHELVPGANLRYRLLTNMDLAGLDLTGADLGYTDIHFTNLAGTILTDAKLDGVISSNLIGVPASLPAGWIIGNGYLIGEEAILPEANLSDLDLTGVNLTGAFLTNAKLKGSILKNANLTKVYLDGADLSGAVLDGVISSGIVGIPAALPAGWSLVDGVLTGP